MGRVGSTTLPAGAVARVLSAGRLTSVLGSCVRLVDGAAAPNARAVKDEGRFCRATSVASDVVDVRGSSDFDATVRLWALANGGLRDVNAVSWRRCCTGAAARPPALGTAARLIGLLLRASGVA